MGGITAWVLADQLSLENPALVGADRVLLIQSTAALGARRFHRQKLHLVLTAMRRYALACQAHGLEVDYLRAASFAAGLTDHVRRHRPERVALLAPHSLRGRRRLGALPGVHLVSGSLFLTDPEAFAAWAAPRRRLVMEDFYRWQRTRLGVLMDGTEPCGGRWNFDTENRRRIPRGLTPPEPWLAREDELDREVRAELDRLGLEGWGEDGPRRWPADHAEAEAALTHFLRHALGSFGPYQDAMAGGERTLWHSLLSSSLNLGLLSPATCIAGAEAAYREGRVDLASAEGFIRQILGWREYVWCLYWRRAEEWPTLNALDAHRPLPAVLEHGRTEMRCIADAVAGLRRTAYAHHIERLMLFGNLTLLCGVEPQLALDWFARTFIDGFEWVMAPNVLGMATWADGGAMTTKPYAASGRYVERMSDHCRACRYQPGRRTGEDACPFTTLYWDFLDTHADRLAGNRRMQMALANLRRLPASERAAIRARAEAVRLELDG
jgi:deoxyribodipyrimidine photolyase-related protein